MVCASCAIAVLFKYQLLMRLEQPWVSGWSGLAATVTCVNHCWHLEGQLAQFAPVLQSFRTSLSPSMGDSTKLKAETDQNWFFYKFDQKWNGAKNNDVVSAKTKQAEFITLFQPKLKINYAECIMYECLLLLTGVIMLELSVNSGYKNVYQCIQSLQRRKLHQTAGHLMMC